jgi:hypothetical protein
MTVTERVPNHEAIAWYVQRAENLLDDLRDRVQSLRSRGGQLAGFSGAVIALAGANAESMLGAVDHAARVAIGISLLVGTIMLIAAFVTSLRGTLLPQLVSDISAKEVANYITERFTHEPDLWRVHVRTIRGLLKSIDSTTRQGDKAAQAVMWAGRDNAKALQTFMGHANISITLDRYGHLLPGSEAEAAGLLDAYMKAERQRAEEAARSAGTNPPAAIGLAGT